MTNYMICAEDFLYLVSAASVGRAPPEEVIAIVRRADVADAPMPDASSGPAIGQGAQDRINTGDPTAVEHPEVQAFLNADRDA